MSKARPQVVVIGAGLGGCLVADRLADRAEVTIVEQGASDGLYLVDEGLPLRIAPYAGSGLGGATRFWANGLIEPALSSYADWPFAADVLDPWMEESHQLLGGTSRATVGADAEALASFAAAAGIDPALVGRPLFYPARTRNVWESLGLAERVATVRGYVDELEVDGAGRVSAVGARTLEGRVRLEADLVVLAAGGLGTPALLQRLPGQAEGEVAGQAGRHYDDHPSAFVAEFTGPAELVRLWDEVGPATGGNVRLPLVVDLGGCSCAFYVRPVAPYRSAQRYGRFSAARERLVDRPWSPGSYAGLLSRPVDLAALAAERAGVLGSGDPTRFNLFMIAGVPPAADSYVWQRDPLEPVHRRWRIEPEHLALMRESVATVLARLGGLIDAVEEYAGWEGRLESGAHHSGTARLAADPATGVCDADGKVFELHNLYVGDGALIPWSGFANTGLTIGALALRLAAHLEEVLR
jgi:hypothetical protein